MGAVGLLVMSEPDTVTLEVPVKADEWDSGIHVDGLMTALDHAAAYHNHESGNYYVEQANTMREEFKEQVKCQLEESED